MRQLIAAGVLAIFALGSCSRENSQESAGASILPLASAAGPDLAAIAGKSRIVDLTVLVGEKLPGHWGSNPPFQRWTYNWFAEKTNEYGTVMVPSEGPYYGQRYVIDEHTGTQTDFPAHFVPPPGSELPHAGEMGSVTGDRYPLDRMMGPAAVMDFTAIRDQAEPGKSAAITVEMVQAWEKQHGGIQPGDVVLFYSGYTNAYYKPMPAGLRMTFEVIVLKQKPGWPAPRPEVMEYLRGKGVWHLGTDGPSMGPAEGGQATHLAGLRHGMSWEEMLIALDQLPPRGAYYLALPLRIVDQSGSPARAIAFVPRGE
jgi:kynurenine formamidase